MTVLDETRQAAFISGVETTVARLLVEFYGLKRLQLEYVSEADPVSWLRTLLNDPSTTKGYTTDEFEAVIAQIGALITAMEVGGTASMVAAFTKVSKG